MNASVPLCIFVLPGLIEVFSRGGLCQYGEGGPAILPLFKSDPFSVAEGE